MTYTANGLRIPVVMSRPHWIWLIYVALAFGSDVYSNGVGQIYFHDDRKQIMTFISNWNNIELWVLFNTLDYPYDVVQHTWNCRQ